jgi:hypothetical protein
MCNRLKLFNIKLFPNKTKTRSNSVKTFVIKNSVLVFPDGSVDLGPGVWLVYCCIVVLLYLTFPDTGLQLEECT